VYGIEKVWWLLVDTHRRTHKHDHNDESGLKKDILTQCKP